MIPELFYVWWFREHATEENCQEFYLKRGVGTSREVFCDDPANRQYVIDDSKRYFLGLSHDQQLALIDEFVDHCRNVSSTCMAAVDDMNTETTETLRIISQELRWGKITKEEAMRRLESPKEP